MPLLSGAMAARRYQVVGDIGAHTRDSYLDRMQEFAFRVPRSTAEAGETHGWVTLQNLCDVEFTTENSFFNQYFCFSLRMDNKKLPAKLIKALLDLKIRAWLQETGRERIPSPVKIEMKEQLELELLPRQLPSVTSHDVCWDTQKQVVWFFSGSNKPNEIFRDHFGKTFSLLAKPISALELVAAHRRATEWVPRLDVIGHCDYRPLEAP